MNGVYRRIACHWCGITLNGHKKFRVGKNVDRTWVCGPDCPQRWTTKRNQRVREYRPGDTVVVRTPRGVTHGRLLGHPARRRGGNAF